MWTGAWGYTFEANKEIITPQPYSNGLAIPVNRSNHHCEVLCGQYGGVELKRNNPQLKHGWDFKV